MALSRVAVSWLLLPALLACGGGRGAVLPDESADLHVGSNRGSVLAGTTPVGPDVGGTQWQWVEAHCTEGPLDLAASGFSAQLRVHAGPSGLLLVQDQRIASIGCERTLIQEATPGDDPDAPWRMTEVSRVPVPLDEQCGGQVEDARPGDVRRRGAFLEVYVQRSVWCNGLEVRFVYAPARPTALEPAQLARHYVAHFNRRDALAVSTLFADNGSLVEPFHLTATGAPTRHDGREAVMAWYAEAFANVPWLAMRLTRLHPAPVEGQLVADWEYMDPRLEEPFAGRNFFTLAAGEIFETQIAILGDASAQPTDGAPVTAPPPAAAPADGTAPAEDPAPAEGEPEAGAGADAS